jgi:LuxR family transcriptional regulator, regulator of acetate metabolism
MATTLFEVEMPSPGDRSTGLTEEERRALRRKAQGLLVPEVAEAMCVSPDIVHVWLASAVRKLGARSKLEAVLIALRRGLINFPRNGRG